MFLDNTTLLIKKCLNAITAKRPILKAIAIRTKFEESLVMGF